MFAIGLACVSLCIVMIFQINQMHKDNCKREEILNSVKSFQCVQCAKTWIITQSLFIAVCVVAGTYIYMVPASVNNEYVLAYILILSIFVVSVILNMIMGYKKQFLFYTNDTFYSDGKMIRFKSIKSIDYPQIIGLAKVKLFSNAETIKVTKEKAIALQRVMNEKH